MDTLFYDGRCPLCNHEIRWLSRAAGSGLRLVDVHDLACPEDWPGVTREQLLRRLHLLLASGEFETGLGASLGAWRHTAFGWLLRPLLWPGIRRVVGRLYERWADRRYCARYGCRVGDQHG